MHGHPAVPTQAERKTKKNKSIRDALPREGERNITDAFLQQNPAPCTSDTEDGTFCIL